jgi:hypothetical protein
MWNPLPANLCSAQSYKTTGRVYEVIGGEAAARTRKLPKSLALGRSQLQSDGRRAAREGAKELA